MAQWNCMRCCWWQNGAVPVWNNSLVVLVGWRATVEWVVEQLLCCGLWSPSVVQDVHLIPAQESKFLCTSLLIDRKGGGSESVTRLRQEKFQSEMQKHLISHQVQILEQISKGAVKSPPLEVAPRGHGAPQSFGFASCHWGWTRGSKEPSHPPERHSVVCFVSERNQAWIQWKERT